MQKPENVLYVKGHIRDRYMKMFKQPHRRYQENVDQEIDQCVDQEKDQSNDKEDDSNDSNKGQSRPEHCLVYRWLRKGV